jgi:peroxiredoxin Q/BCP
MPELTVGMPAPEFTLPTADGSRLSLEDYRGKKVILYFYPKDNTPGCTKEACAFRDVITQVEKRGAVVLGISVDSIESHKKFSDKFGLPFPLGSDAAKETVKRYGVWKEKSMYGRKFLGIERTTFVIDGKGLITHIFRKVKVGGHVDEVLGVL